MIWNIKVWQTCKKIKNQEGGQHFFTPLYMGSWRINVSYGVKEKCKKNKLKKTSNIEDRPLSCYL